MWFNWLKTVYLWMTWIMISGIQRNNKIHSISYIRGHSFKMSTKYNQFFDTFLTPHHPQKWTIDLLFKNNRTCKNVTNFKNPPLTFCVVVINVYSFTQITLFPFLLWQITFAYTSWNLLETDTNRKVKQDIS